MTYILYISIKKHAIHNNIIHSIRNKTNTILHFLHII